MSDEEVRRHSVVKITNPNLLDILEKPIPGGLYDPAMGPLDENSPCKSCGQRAYHCAGHCGHIDLVSPAYNPLLFNTLSNLLNKTCFYCFQFRTSRREVENCVSQLELITKGDIVGAKRLSMRQNLQDKKNMDWVLSDDIVDPEDSQGSHTSHSSGISGDQNHYDHNSQACWDSSQLTEAMSVLNEFLKKKGRKCKSCECNNPKINKPTFGWFHVSGLSDTQLRSNAIRRSRLDVADSGGGEERPSSEVVNASDFRGRMILRQLKRIPLLPPLIPLKSPARKVMEHPQTVLLGKVLQSNIALGNAHVNNAERSKIINRWMDLQQSINVLFDSKTANSQAQKDGTSGICQFLEKKEGIFRQKMMGKRVNFACRSVISPDPYLAVNEIGIPPYFALRLTYPESMKKSLPAALEAFNASKLVLAGWGSGILVMVKRVTPWNAGKLRGAVINGPEIHPGATTYVDSVSTVKLPSSKKMRVAISRKLPSSRGSQSGKINELEFEGKFVYRHLQDGDIVCL
ncbi:UNVERIFIED_CONTAM: DNA-directed RNA polymerase I subunit [Sesamum radiatum]|uniref:DNA-directed RNA polymerase subunit n=1 Tax=Sesamum radiatum TaxID=300843 RepID=A0AAW2NAX0_SESRA